VNTAQRESRGLVDIGPYVSASSSFPESVTNVLTL
jgi:hypothetical protein